MERRDGTAVSSEATTTVNETIAAPPDENVSLPPPSAPTIIPIIPRAWADEITLEWSHVFPAGQQVPQPSGVQQEPRVETPITEPNRPAVDTLPARISLIPRFVIEVLRHPFKDFTLVRGGGEVFVAERGANLGGKDLSRVNLRDANLERANLERALLTEANLEAANLANANLKNAVLVGANLRGANLHGATLTGADFRRADLWGAVVSIEALSQAMTEGALLDRSATPG